MDHATVKCKKPINTSPRCAHCMLNHTANYKGCRVYQHFVSNRTTRNYSNGHRTSNVNINSTEFSQLKNK